METEIIFYRIKVPHYGRTHQTDGPIDEKKKRERERDKSGWERRKDRLCDESMGGRFFLLLLLFSNV